MAMSRLFSALVVALVLCTALTGAAIARDIVELGESIEDFAEERGLNDSARTHDLEEQPTGEAPEDYVGVRAWPAGRILDGILSPVSASPQVALLVAQPFRPPTVRP